MSDQNNIPTPRTKGEEIVSELREIKIGASVSWDSVAAFIIDRELATVTKERDHWKRECNIETLRAGERATERDSLRAKVADLIRQQDCSDESEAQLTKENGKLRAELGKLKGENNKLTNRNAALAVMAGIPEPLKAAGTITLGEMTIPLFASELEEPSRVGGKKVCDSCHWCNTGLLNVGCSQDGLKIAQPFWICHSCIKREHDELAAAQATIAKLEKERDKAFQPLAKWLEENDQLRAENAALRAETEKEMDARFQISAQLATVIADRNAEHQFGSQMQAERDSVQSQLNAEKVKLGVAIAERDELQKGNEMLRGYSADFDHMRGNLIATIRERDSALAACAAKDKILSLCGQELMHLSRFGFVRNQTRLSNQIDDALSPTAGSDYVPKAPMENLYSKATLLVEASSLGVTARFEALKLLSTALTAAAPFLTDSTGEEGK